MLPHLTTALTGPVIDLERRLLNDCSRIERWFRGQWQESTPPLYASVDLRNSGFKLSPVDTNLFPGGFNNLGQEMLPLAVQAAMSAVEKICPAGQNLLLIPENHTRNRFYLENVAQLAAILRQTGLNIRIGTMLPDITEPTPVELESNRRIVLEPLVRKGHRLGLADFDPCMIVLNNDLSAGVPDILLDLNEQFLLPPLHAGWATRRKTHHFEAYRQVAAMFADLIGIDPWSIDPYFSGCRSIDFHERHGEACLAHEVDTVLGKIRTKYREYGIDDTPYVVVKADAGTYGMGVMTVKDASEVVGLNRKQRNKMSVIKEGQQVSEVIIQEGVHTVEQVGDGSAEPVVYMIDRYVIGGFYRVNDGRARDENLNAPGMYFRPMPFDTSCCLPDLYAQPDAPPNRFYTYGVIARLALLAASRELEIYDPAQAGSAGSEPLVTMVA